MGQLEFQDQMAKWWVNIEDFSHLFTINYPLHFLNISKSSFRRMRQLNSLQYSTTDTNTFCRYLNVKKGRRFCENKGYRCIRSGSIMVTVREWGICKNCKCFHLHSLLFYCLLRSLLLGCHRERCVTCKGEKALHFISLFLGRPRPWWWTWSSWWCRIPGK